MPRYSTAAQVFALIPVADNIEVVCTAYNDDTACAEVRGCTAYMVNGVATFDDLRFHGRSGRGAYLQFVCCLSEYVCLESSHALSSLPLGRCAVFVCGRHRVVCVGPRQFFFPVCACSVTHNEAVAAGICALVLFGFLKQCALGCGRHEVGNYLKHHRSTTDAFTSSSPPARSILSPQARRSTSS